jgi:RNA polymerase sigma-70 factor (ECF subfamily)
LETTLTSRAVLGTRARADAGVRAEDFEELVRLHQRRIYRVLLAIVRDPDAADTLTQECFLRAYEKRASFRGESSVGTWLVRIAVNLARDHTKNRRQTFWRRLFQWTRDDEPMAHAERVADAQASPERVLVARQEAAAVWSAVEELPSQQRAVFVMRFVEEMPLGEIARAMGLEVGTVKSHLHRAVSTVRKKLKA